MTEAIYKVGDVLEFKSSQYFPACMYNISGPFRALIIRVDDLGYEYVASYRLLLFSKECNNFINRYMSILQKDIITNAKRIGHIDISLLRYEEKEQEEPDYAMFFTAATIAQAADLRNENEKLKAENKALSDTLSKSEEKAHSRLDRISFLTRKVNELESTNNDLKTELNEKVEELKKVYNSDLVCEDNRLLVEANKKLSADNARYLQSITCARKQMTEAAKRICEAEEHMDVALNNK